MTQKGWILLVGRAALGEKNKGCTAFKVFPSTVFSLPLQLSFLLLCCFFCYPFFLEGDEIYSTWDITDNIIS